MNIQILYQLILIDILLLASYPAIAQNKDREIVITATAFPTDEAATPGTIQVISTEEIQAKHQGNLAQALADVTGVFANTAGGRGKQSNFFLRGSESNQVVILIDGFQVYDPSSPGRGLDLSLMNLDHVKRIEVLKGPQSGLYGSDAMGGVVNIITVDGKAPDFVRLNSEAFTLGGGKGAVSFKAGGPGGFASGSASYEASQSISAANEADGNREKDGYRIGTAHLRARLTPSESFQAGVSTRYSSNHTDVDEGGGPGADDRNYTQSQELTTLGIDAGWLPIGEAVEVVPRGQLTQMKRRLKNDLDGPNDTSTLRQTYLGNMAMGGVALLLRPNESAVTTIAYEQESEFLEIEDELVAESSQDKVLSETKSAYLQQYYQGDTLFAGVNCRYDDHLDAGAFRTYRVAPGLIVSRDLTLKASFGTGAKVPSLYQLHSAFGNRDLQVETSEGFDIGLVRTSEVHEFELVAFETRTRNQIDYSFAENRFENIGKTRARGLEIRERFFLLPSLQFSLSLTLQTTRNEITKEPLLRRPQMHGSLVLLFKPSDAWLVRPSYRYVGERQDFSEQLPAYSLVGTYGSWQLSKQIRMYATVENLMNARYEEVAGYGTPGRHGSLGVEAEL